MRTASKLVAAFGAGVLGFALLAAPAWAGPDQTERESTATADAAPGNANRDVENGGSGTQGKSHSNPDGEGVDKPYEAAGQAAESQGDSDFDGNNGCGNDADFADDNNGNCGGLKKGHTKEREEGGSTEVGGETGSKPIVHTPQTDVLANGETVTQPAGTAAALGSVADTQGAQVLGVQYERPAAAAAAGAETRPVARVLSAGAERGAALARTGSGLGLLAVVALVLIGAGIVARRSAAAS